MMEEELRQEEQEQIRQGQPQNQNSAHNTVEQREAENRLLDIVSNQLHALGAAVNRTGMFLLALCLVVVMETAALIGVTLWHSSAISRMQAEMERQHVAEHAERYCRCGSRRAGAVRPGRGVSPGVQAHAHTAIPKGCSSCPCSEATRRQAEATLAHASAHAGRLIKTKPPFRHGAGAFP